MPFGRLCGSFRTVAVAHAAPLPMRALFTCFPWLLLKELVVHESEHRAAPASSRDLELSRSVLQPRLACERCWE